MINRHFFFDYAKRHLFKSRLSQKQVDGLNVILGAWEASYARKDDPGNGVRFHGRGYVQLTGQTG
jgi:hypothetical protein